MRQLRICHVASGDLWAGAEAQIALLLHELSSFSDLKVSAIILNGGKLSAELGANNIPTIICDESRLNSVQLLKAFYSHFNALRPDIVHTHRYKENVLAGIAGKFASVPFGVQTVHGMQENLPRWPQIRMSAYASLNRVVARWTRQNIIGVSAEITAIMKRALPRNGVLYVPNGIDLEKVTASLPAAAKRKELGLPAEAIVIGTVCRLVPVKRIEFLLAVFARLCRELPDISMRLVVVGDGPMRPQLEAEAKRWNIDGTTQFLGERKDVYDLMNAFDIYALSSLHEGIPMALLEAMALGLPIVASRVGGVPEVLTEAEGKLISADDMAGFTDALRELIVSPEARSRMGSTGSERVRRAHESKNTSARVRELYRALMEERLETSSRFGILREGGIGK
jgi:L-malate glycosyltransferase